MSVRFATRLAAANMGGTGVYADLKPGDRFVFPPRPNDLTVVLEKLRGGWYRRVIAGQPGVARFRTSPGTAVILLRRPS